jgi:hypothetical protein
VIHVRGHAQLRHARTHTHSHTELIWRFGASSTKISLCWRNSTTPSFPSWQIFYLTQISVCLLVILVVRLADLQKFLIIIPPQKMPIQATLRAHCEYITKYFKSRTVNCLLRMYHKFVIPCSQSGTVVLKNKTKSKPKNKNGVENFVTMFCY